jgi:SRSO17 transposase
VSPWLLETFVDRDRFDGGCYRAANWVAVGWTKGYEKQQGRFVYHGRSKEVYVYVLNRGMRRAILEDAHQPLLTREFLLSIRSEAEASTRRARMMKIQQSWEPKPSPEFELTGEDIATWIDELRAFHQRFEIAFKRVEQIELSQHYLQGLMSKVKRKNVEAMALHLTGPQKVRGMQRFVSQYKWDEDLLRQRHWQEVSTALNSPDGVLSVDASETGKKGAESVGVAPQYCGNLGKVANCQSGVYVCYATGQGHLLLASRLYMPKCWFTDEYEPRLRKCRVPEDLQFQTKPEIAAALITQVHESELFDFQWVTMDASFGNNEALLQQLPAGLKYLADIPATRKLWPKTAAQAPELERSGCTAGQLPGVPGLLDWQHCKVAEGCKGPTVYDFARIRVYLSADRNPEDERWLWLRNGPDGQIKYALSNAPETEPFEEMVRVSMYRWPIERSFQEGKGELGMDHYEHRAWCAWHRHMLMVGLAQLFLLTLRLKYKKSPGSDSASMLQTLAGRPAGCSL